MWIWQKENVIPIGISIFNIYFLVKPTFIYYNSKKIINITERYEVLNFHFQNIYILMGIHLILKVEKSTVAKSLKKNINILGITLIFLNVKAYLILF